MTPLQREPGQHDSAERTLEAAYTIFLIWNNTPSIELGFGRRFSIATHSPSMSLGLRLALSGDFEGDALKASADLFRWSLVARCSNRCGSWLLACDLEISLCLPYIFYLTYFTYLFENGFWCEADVF